MRATQGSEPGKRTGTHRPNRKGEPRGPRKAPEVRREPGEGPKPSSPRGGGEGDTTVNESSRATRTTRKQGREKPRDQREGGGHGSAGKGGARRRRDTKADQGHGGKQEVSSEQEAARLRPDGAWPDQEKQKVRLVTCFLVSGVRRRAHGTGAQVPRLPFNSGQLNLW